MRAASPTSSAVDRSEKRPTRPRSSGSARVVGGDSPTRAACRVALCTRAAHMESPLVPSRYLEATTRWPRKLSVLLLIRSHSGCQNIYLPDLDRYATVLQCATTRLPEHFRAQEDCAIEQACLRQAAPRSSRLTSSPTKFSASKGPEKFDARAAARANAWRRQASIPSPACAAHAVEEHDRDRHSTRARRASWRNATARR